jgi:hypothetical protein
LAAKNSRNRIEARAPAALIGVGTVLPILIWIGL